MAGVTGEKQTVQRASRTTRHRAACVFMRGVVYLLASTAASPGQSPRRLVAPPPTNMTTWRNDISRSGLNTAETVLTPSNVNSAQFGKICSATVDGQVYAQPLVATNVTINGQLYSSVVYVVTQNDGVYAFDGNSAGPTCTQLLYTNLLQSGEFPVNCTEFGKCGAISPIIGILGTPVIDTTSNVIYLISQAQVGSPPTTYTHRVHALNITNFNEMFDGPAVVAGTYGTLSFTSSNHIQRPGLLLLSGSPSYVYVAFSKIDAAATDPSGWIFRYNAQELGAAPVTFATAPNGNGSGVWQGGAGLAAGIDSTNGHQYIYFGTADGTFDASTGGSDYGDSFVKLSTDLSTVAGYFTPYNQACMDTTDTDFGSGGVVLIPNGLIPAHPYLAVAGDKEGSLYVIDRGNPGGYGGTGNCLGTNSNIQTITGLTPIHNAPAYWDGNLYFAPTRNGTMLKYRISPNCSPGPICSSPTTSKVTFPAGASPSISVNGNTASSAIVWAIWGDRYPSGGPPAILYAFNPSNLTELYDSNQCGTQDVPGAAIKFSVPTVANGRVFIGTQTDFDIYAELSSSRTCP